MKRIIEKEKPWGNIDFSKYNSYDNMVTKDEKKQKILKSIF